MKNVVIYTRVSTDEQAEKGFSLRHQDESLRRHCEFKGYNVVRAFSDDFSAKTFDRPEWEVLWAFVKDRKNKVDLVLFTRWDRFSRNHSAALIVLKNFSKIGIEINSAEQPLDLSQPESKIILAIYLSVPEVENDKNSIRTIEGSRRARKEGCWTGSAPFGFKNHRDESGKSTLIPHPDKASLVKEAFDLYSTGIYAMDQVRKLLYSKGLRVCKNNFPHMLRNPAYMGMIYLAPYKSEQAQVVEGIHEGLVSKDLWVAVQDVISGKKRHVKKPSSKNEMLPLRQQVICPDCGRKLTGSASTSRNKMKHYYYHCYSPCKFRVKADALNEKLLKKLSDISIPDSVADLYREVLMDVYKTRGSDRSTQIKNLKQEYTRIQETIQNAEDRLFEGKVDLETFNSAKSRYLLKLEEINQEIQGLKNQETDLKDQIEFSVYLLQHLDNLYDNSTFEVKTAILGSTFPEKLKIRKSKSRTTRNQYKIGLFGTLNAVFWGEKERARHVFHVSPKGAPPLGLEPRTL